MDPEFVNVMSVEELKQRTRAIVSVNDRIVALFYVKDEIYAMDHFCYRKYLPTSACVNVSLPRHPLIVGL